MSADGAEWIKNVVERRLPADRQAAPMPPCAWTRSTWCSRQPRPWTCNAARRAGQKALAKELKGARFALWKKPEDLSERQQAKLANIAETNKPLYRAYMLKEQLRQVFELRGAEAIGLLDAWLAWAQRLPAGRQAARSSPSSSSPAASASTTQLSRPPSPTTSPTLRSSPSTPGFASSPASPSGSTCLPLGRQRRGPHLACHAQPSQACAHRCQGGPDGPLMVMSHPRRREAARPPIRATTYN
jgi:hypothetical protein